VWEKGGLIYKDIPFVTKSGTIVPVECSAKVAPFAGRPAIVIYARDITNRLRLEKEIQHQNKIIEEKNKDITDSIEYSKRIQQSVFKEKEQLKTLVPESFIFFKPCEIVSGDFYWFTDFEIKKDVVAPDGYNYKTGTHLLVVAAADCTGHGVPGAFMSIIGNSLLNQTINNPAVNSSAKALNFIDLELKKSLNKNKDEAPLRDGMDIALCCIDLKGMTLEYAGANNPIYIVRNKELIEIKSDKQAITASIETESIPFKNNLLTLQKNDCIYLFTDGFADQFGLSAEARANAEATIKDKNSTPEQSNLAELLLIKGKKFMYKQIKETLISIQDKNMEEQKAFLFHTFESWKGNLPQVDDVLMIGIKV